MSRATEALLILTLSVLLALMTGLILMIGKPIILPIVVAVISVYVLSAASDALGRWRLTGWLPGMARRFLLFVIFIGAVGTLAGVVISTGQALIDTAPSYQANLEAIGKQIGAFLPGRIAHPDWSAIRSATLDQVRVQRVLGVLLGQVSSLAGLVFMIIVYAMFLMGERGSFAHKISVALPGKRTAAQTRQILHETNARIGDYLAVKTLVNAILAALSFLIMWVFGVDYALFWALMIGLLNYIPYIGSIIGVFFPVLLTVAQFGSLHMTLAVGIALTAAQIWVGNMLEPRLVGRKVNLSPFVVMVALSVWSALWGVAGAILAIPMTSVLCIVFAALPMTRPLAVLLADDVSVFENREPAP